MNLVTGATGLLGRVIVLDLLKRNEKVRATKRPSSNLEEVRRSFAYYTENPDFWFEKIEWVEVDFEDQDTLSAALKEVTSVYHCAAKVSFDSRDRKELYHTNIRGTENLLYACEGSSVEQFCFVSSSSVLDGKNAEGFYDEESEFKPALRHSAYAESKHFSEMEVWRAAAEGLHLVVVVPGMIIGSGNWESSSGALFSNFEKNPFTFSGSFGYVDVRDVAEISIQLMEKKCFKERYVLVAGNEKHQDFSALVRESAGRKPARKLSDTLLKGASWFSFLGFIFPILKLANKENIEALLSDTQTSSKKVKEELNYQFIPVEESIRFHLKNYLAYKKHKP